MGRTIDHSLPDEVRPGRPQAVHLYAEFFRDVAGPVFSQIMGGALRTMGIVPDAPIQVAEAAAGKGRL